MGGVLRPGGESLWLSFKKLSSLRSFVMLVFFSLRKPSPSTSCPSSWITTSISSRSGWMYSGRAAMSKIAWHVAIVVV